MVSGGKKKWKVHVLRFAVSLFFTLIFFWGFLLSPEDYWVPITAFLILYLSSYLMARWENAQEVVGGVFKINLTVGLHFMDHVGKRFSRFWVFIGDLALILLFGGLGTGFVASHTSERNRRILLTILVFVVTYIVLGTTFITFIPFGIFFEFSLEALLLATLFAVAIYRFSPRLRKSHQVLLSFILASVFFSWPYMYSFFVTGNIESAFFGVLVGILGLPAYVIGGLAIHGFNIIIGATSQPGINPGYAAVEEGTAVLKFAGTDLSIPIFPDILIAFLIMLLIHEGFHGLVARAQGIRLVNTGIITSGILPLGAFVEPDEEQFKKEKEEKKLRVYAVGSFSNIFVVALILFLLIGFLLSQGFVKSDGFISDRIIQGSAAEEYIQVGDIIYEVNEVKTPTPFEFRDVMSKTKPNQTIKVETNRGTFFPTLNTSSENESKGFLGVGWDPRMDPILGMIAPDYAASHLVETSFLPVFNLLKWIFFLNLMVGLVNLLPIRFIPLDGLFIYEGLFSWLQKSIKRGKKYKIWSRLFQILMFIVILAFVVNFAPYFNGLI